MIALTLTLSLTVACSTSPEAQALREKSMNTVEDFTEGDAERPAVTALKAQLSEPDTFDARMEESLDSIDDTLAVVKQELPDDSAQHKAVATLEQEIDAARFELEDLSLYAGAEWRAQALALRVEVKDIERRVEAMEETL